MGSVRDGEGKEVRLPRLEPPSLQDHTSPYPSNSASNTSHIFQPGVEKSRGLNN